MLALSVVPQLQSPCHFLSCRLLQTPCMPLDPFHISLRDGEKLLQHLPGIYQQAARLPKPGTTRGGQGSLLQDKGQLPHSSLSKPMQCWGRLRKMALVDLPLTFCCSFPITVNQQGICFSKAGKPIHKRTRQCVLAERGKGAFPLKEGKKKRATFLSTGARPESPDNMDTCRTCRWLSLPEPW